MIQRIKLMRIKTKFEIDSLYQFFKKNVFTPKSSFGFLNQELYNNKVFSTYVEKEIINQEFTDPLGEPYTQVLLSYNSFQFTIEPMSNDLFLLSIISPPRSIKNFIARLSEGLEYNIAFSSVDFSIGDLVEYLTTAEEISLLKITKLKASGVRFNESSTANIEITSKSNAIYDLNDYLINSRYVIDKLAGNMIFNNHRIFFETTKNGLMSITQGFPSNFIFKSIKF
ncbi:hypothetical protein [Aeromonas caviae]|uniref:hypothetical protein n=1 Tax=Aeromonas caviae TaxID=648 RepID=UPI002B48E7C0|nr:hypothetical protein [Aeromonas caviae]